MYFVKLSYSLRDHYVTTHYVLDIVDCSVTRVRVPLV